jgi:hypothetical protein
MVGSPQRHGDFLPVLARFLCTLSYTSHVQIIYILVRIIASHLVHAWFQASFPGVSTCHLAYSIGTLPCPKTPFFSIAILYSLPAPFMPGASIVLSSSQAICIDWYILSKHQLIALNKPSHFPVTVKQKRKQTDITPSPHPPISSASPTSTHDESSNASARATDSTSAAAASLGVADGILSRRYAGPGSTSCRSCLAGLRLAGWVW